METMLNYAYTQENFEIFQFKHRTLGHGVWYNPQQETYESAIDRANQELYKKVAKEYPHLNLPIPSVLSPAAKYFKEINQPKEPVIVNYKGKTLLSAINNAQTKAELESLELFLDSDEADIAWKERLIQLQNS